MWVNPELNASDAFVAALLPGSEGRRRRRRAVRARGRPSAARFQGKLCLFAGRRRADQTPLNAATQLRPAVRATATACTYASRGASAELRRRPRRQASATAVLRRGPRDGVALSFRTAAVARAAGRSSPGEPARPCERVDRRRRKMRARSIWSGQRRLGGRAAAAPPIVCRASRNGDRSLVVECRSTPRRRAVVDLSAWRDCACPIAGALHSAAAVGRWDSKLAIPLRCFAEARRRHARVSSAVRTESVGTRSD